MSWRRSTGEQLTYCNPWDWLVTSQALVAKPVDTQVPRHFKVPGHLGAHLSQDKRDGHDQSHPTIVGHQYTGSLLQDSAGLLTINGFALPAKLAEKRKLIEEFAHNDVKKVSMIYFTISFI